MGGLAGLVDKICGWRRHSCFDGCDCLESQYEYEAIGCSIEPSKAWDTGPTYELVLALLIRAGRGRVRAAILLRASADADAANRREATAADDRYAAAAVSISDNTTTLLRTILHDCVQSNLGATLARW